MERMPGNQARPDLLMGPEDGWRCERQSVPIAAAGDGSGVFWTQVPGSGLPRGVRTKEQGEKQLGRRS